MFCSGLRAVAGLLLMALVAGCTPVGVPSPAQTPPLNPDEWAELPVSPLSPRHGAAGALG